MKEEIVKRALNDFMQYGFKTFTMDDLASKMGISKKRFMSTSLLKTT